MTRRRSGRLLALHLVVIALVAACTHGGHAGKPVAPPTPLTTDPQTSLPDRSSDSLGNVSGRTTMVIALTPGRAALNGTVAVTDGTPVPGAVVHLERIVGDQYASADIAAGADGTWNAPGIIGGLYRVRAWRAPDLAQTNPAILFLGATDTSTVTLRVDKFTGVQVSSAIAPNPPIIASPANLVVAVNVATVGQDGIVRGQGRAGVTLQLFGEGQWSIEGSLSKVTGSGGTASWRLTCTALGPQPLSVLVNGTDAFPLDLPSCSPVPPTTTTPPPTTATTVPGETTTTGRRRVTTTTTR
ncbi:MAG: hypothetical protein NVS1B12_09520 [Acidimicrobiales bacterium]